MKIHAEPPLTIADLDATPDDGNRYELIEGELHVSTAPGYLHQSVLLKLGSALLNFLRLHPIADVVPGVGIIFDDFNGVIPDLIVVTNERKQRLLAGGRLTAAPEIVVEILSPGATNERRDRRLKWALYSVRGVHEYWIVDPESRSIELWRKRKTGGLELAVNLQSGDELTSMVLPEFRVTVGELFE